MSLTKQELWRHFYEGDLKAYQASQGSTKAKVLIAKAIAAEAGRRLLRQKKRFRILDVGCGDGKLAHELVRSLSWYRPDLEIQLLGIDISAKVLEQAKANLRDLKPNVSVDLKQVGVYPPPAPELRYALNNKSFDLVFASLMVHWLDNIPACIAELYSCLRPGGRLCIAAISKSEDGKNEYAEFRKHLFQIAHGEELTSGPFVAFFSDDIKKLVETGLKIDKSKKKDLDKIQTRIIKSEIDIGKEIDIHPKIEFFMASPKKELTKTQEEKVKHHLEATAKNSGKLMCECEMIWVKKPKEIKALSGEWYFIFPFLLDPMELVEQKSGQTSAEKNDHSNNWLNTVIDNTTEPNFKKGLPPSRLGFLPILPYRSLEEDIIHYEETWKDDDRAIEIHKVAHKDMKKGSYPKVKGKEKSVVRVTETTTIHSSGIGAITYKLTLDPRWMDKDKLDEEDFVNMARLVPRTYQWKKGTGYYEGDPNFWVLEGQLLADRADKKVETIAKSIAKIPGFKKDIDLNQFIEDSLVYHIKSNSNNETECSENAKMREEFRQPFVVVNLQVDENTFTKDIRDFWMNVPGGETIYQWEEDHIYRQIVNLVYRFWILGAKVAPGLIGREREPAPIRMVDHSEGIATFVCLYTALNIYREGVNEFVKGDNVKTMLGAVEKSVCKNHFVHTLDALFDELINKICQANELKDVEKHREELDRYRTQAALMLEEISQYVTGGLLGSEMYRVLKEVFQSKELEERVLRKIELCGKLLDSKEWQLKSRSLSRMDNGIPDPDVVEDFQPPQWPPK